VLSHHTHHRKTSNGHLDLATHMDVILEKRYDLRLAYSSAEVTWMFVAGRENINFNVIYRDTDCFFVEAKSKDKERCMRRAMLSKSRLFIT
jgi:DNA polymerase elongation subunit (family B)